MFNMLNKVCKTCIYQKKIACINISSISGKMPRWLLIVPSLKFSTNLRSHLFIFNRTDEVGDVHVLLTVPIYMYDHLELLDSEAVVCGILQFCLCLRPNISRLVSMMPNAVLLTSAILISKPIHTKKRECHI